MCPVQDAIGQMPQIWSHCKPNRWEGEHMPTILGPIWHIIRPAALGIDFPINHAIYPHNHQNTACTKIDCWYRPGSWVITMQNFNKSDDDFEIDSTSHSPPFCMESMQNGLSLH